MRFSILRFIQASGMILLALSAQGQQNLELNEQEYFHTNGLDVTVFSDYYPEGHQSGISIIQHGVRVAANGDLRLEPSPGQWSPVPKAGKRIVDRKQQSISQELWFPDSSRNGIGFNPIAYPDLRLRYQVHAEAMPGNSIRVKINLERALPEEWVGKVGFNLELFPGELFGKSYLLDGQSGLFPDQPTGPLSLEYGEPLTQALASGSRLVIAPEEDLQRMVIRSLRGELELWDGRSNHNNGWFIVRSKVPEHATEGAIEWIITPSVNSAWQSPTVIQVNQLGYHPEQKKVALVELDPQAAPAPTFSLLRMGEGGGHKVLTDSTEHWGKFLRYQYLRLDFSEIRESGIYQLLYGDQRSRPFQIDRDVYGHKAWQATLDYFLPVQMCHMRVNEKYRVWHDLCHVDDALMAPHTPHHFDGYKQPSENLTDYQPLKAVPGLDHGGWHDAGDYDLRVESQAGTVWLLALMMEEFHLDHDATLIDQEKRLVEIHEPDGINDAIQQIEHGLASILGGYRSLGRLYRGIICSDKGQYVLLGDAAAMTDNIKGNADDRWVFTEDNPARVLQVIPALAAASRVLSSPNPELAGECWQTAIALWKEVSRSEGLVPQKVLALSELILCGRDESLADQLLEMKNEILEYFPRCGWAVGRVLHHIQQDEFIKQMGIAVDQYQKVLQQEQKSDSPYGVPYKPNIWGAGWGIQRFGVEQYFYHKAWPGQTSSDFTENALHFILGVHPGSNNASFASGVGSKSIKVAYGVNRADWSFIPGGVVSGTALIRPDFPELKTWPYLWQQTEYVMGGGACNYMFLVLAVRELYGDSQK